MRNPRALAIGLTVAIVISGSGCSGGTDSERTNAAKASAALLHKQRARREALELALRRARAERFAREAASEVADSGPGSPRGKSPLSADDQAAFNAFAESIAGEIGLAVQPLGEGPTVLLGTLQSGHAWSSIKVPILVTLIRDHDGALSSSERVWAEAAIESSDNEAAASLFAQLEEIHGGLTGASAAVQETLAAGGDTETTVATAPPPAGAISTYGQTEWSLTGATSFYRALANGCLLDPETTAWVLGLMEDVIPEQRWGLGEAGFDPAWWVGMKGGWGPEAESGGYLVRQSGLVRNGSAGIAITLMAKDASGTYEAGAADLTATASWIRDHLDGLGPAATGC